MRNLKDEEFKRRIRELTSITELSELEMRYVSGGDGGGTVSPPPPPPPPPPPGGLAGIGLRGMDS